MRVLHIQTLQIHNTNTDSIKTNKTLTTDPTKYNPDIFICLQGKETTLDTILETEGTQIHIANF